MRTQRPEEAAQGFLLVGGAGGGVHTWFLQDQNRRVTQAPAIGVTISAKKAEVTLQNQQDFLSIDNGLGDKANVRLISGAVAIKNVGTSQTSVQLCECVRPGANGHRIS
jgi:hypothetical protein